MAKNDLVLAGPASNQAFFNKWIKSNPLVTGLNLRSIERAPFDEDWDNELVPTMAYLATFGRALYLIGAGVIDMNLVHSVTCAEMLGPYIAQSVFCTDQATARDVFRKSVTHLIYSNKLASVSTATQAGYNEFIENPDLRADEVINVNLGPMAQADWPDYVEGAILSFDAAMRILAFVARNATKAYAISKLNIIVHTLVSVMKRGNVSPAFVEMIRRGIMDDLSLTIDLRKTSIQYFFRYFGVTIDDVNIQEIVKRWTQHIPPQALRLLLTIQQLASEIRAVPDRRSLRAPHAGGQKTIHCRKM